jgi:hypothetical protein
MTQPIIERIRCLLALSTSSNVNEAAAAANAAQRLMAKYQIDVLELEATVPGREEPAVDTEVFDQQRRTITWRNHIANALADANLCVLYLHRQPERGLTQIKIVGTSEAISMVRYMHAYLVHQVERLWQEESARGVHTSRAAGSGFRLGAAVTLGKRLKEATKVVRHEASPGAIVLVNQHLARVEAAVGCMLSTTPRRSTYRDASAFERGKAAGNSVNLAGGPALGRGSAANLRA